MACMRADGERTLGLVVHAEGEQLVCAGAQA